MEADGHSSFVPSISGIGSRRVIFFSQEVSSESLRPYTMQLRVKGWVREDMGRAGRHRTQRAVQPSIHTWAPRPLGPPKSAVWGFTSPQREVTYKAQKQKGQVSRMLGLTTLLDHSLGRGCLVPGGYSLQGPSPQTGPRVPRLAGSSAERDRHLDPSNNLPTLTGSVNCHPSPRVPARSQVCLVKPQTPAPPPPRAPNQGRPARCRGARSS